MNGQYPDHKGRNNTDSRKRKANRPNKTTPTGEKKKLPKTRKIDPASLLHIPNKEYPNVLQKPQNIPKADPRALGVKRHIQFPSGAVLIKCSNKELANKLRQTA